MDNRKLTRTTWNTLISWKFSSKGNWLKLELTCTTYKTNALEIFAKNQAEYNQKLTRTTWKSLSVTIK